MNQNIERLTSKLGDTVYYAKGKYPPNTLCTEMENWEVRECMQRLAELEGKLESKKPQPLKYKPLLEIGWKYSCPSCGCAIGMNSNCIDYTQEDVYCPTCGQRLDWSV